VRAGGNATARRNGQLQPFSASATMGDMDCKAKPKRIGWKFAAVGLVVVFLIAYVLSSGPVACLVIKGWISVDSFDDMYKPLLWVSRYSAFRVDLARCCTPRARTA
jgi:hypothetical protein